MAFCKCGGCVGNAGVWMLKLFHSEVKETHRCYRQDIADTLVSEHFKHLICENHIVDLYDGGGNCFGGVKVKVWTDTAKSTDVVVVGIRQYRSLIGDGNVKPRLRAD